jgi:cbb3-type cytochrome c oxidase subunit III
LNRVMGVRIVIVAAAIASVIVALQWMQGPIEAAQQKPAQTSSLPAKDAGAESYDTHCAICHGDLREGILPAFPPLTGIHHQMKDEQIAELIHAGKGRMPGFPSLQNEELSALMHFLTSADPASAATQNGAESGLAEVGGEMFHQNCAFCHGRDAMGGESGPDLTQSKLVLQDKTGEKITEVVREGRPDKKMPAFNFSSQELLGLVAFIRAREAAAAAHPGGRRGVAVADLQTGNIEAGRQYFDGAGGCAKCHSATGDLAGIASRFEGLKLEQRMLYPEGAQRTVDVTLASGQKISGKLAYLDEFTVALRDRSGTYRSWATSRVRFSVNSPMDAHVELFSKYTDDDIHNLMAYLQTLR